MELAFWFFDPPPLFSGCQTHFFISHGHTERLGTCAEMAVLGGYSWYARLCSPYTPMYMQLLPFVAFLRA